MRALLVLALAGCAASHPSHPPPATAASTPIELPPIELHQLDGQARALKDELAGRPALLSLWATWCDTCMTELGALDRLSGKAAAQGAYVVAISEGEDAATVSAFVKTKKLAYAQLLDPSFALADALGSRRVPATLVVDRRGHVVYRGAALSEDALRALDRAIDETKPSD